MTALRNRDDAKHVYFLEFNELSNSLIDRFIDEGALPNFKRFRDESEVLITESEETGFDLEPWIQWVSVHTGCPLSVHGVRNLGDNLNLRVKTIGDCLSEAGIAVGIFGSMNLRQEKLVGFFVPDPWDRNGQAQPEELQTYYDVIGSQVRGGPEDSIPELGDLARLAMFLASHGISWRTIDAGVRQLIVERRKPQLTWRRAVVLDRLNYDVARSLHRKHRPCFSTFFSNSTAHFQHYFWQNLDPELFPGRTDIDASEDGNAILYGYKNVDYLLGRFMDDYPDSMLILVTALSQEPWTDTRKQTYRPHNFTEFLSFCGIHSESSSVSPIMAEEFRVEPRDGQTIEDIRSIVNSTRLEDGRLLLKAQYYDDSVILGCAIDVAQQESTTCINAVGETQPFMDLLRPIYGQRSGKHNPEGVFWIRNGKTTASERRSISLYEIAPATLEFFGVRRPSTMPSPSISLA